MRCHGRSAFEDHDPDWLVNPEHHSEGCREYALHAAGRHSRLPPRARRLRRCTMKAMYDHPAYLELMVEEMALFTDTHGDILLVALGELEQMEMADRVYLTLASLFSVDELRRRLQVATDGDEVVALSARVSWRGLTVIGPLLHLTERGQGDPVTTVSLSGVIDKTELLD